MKSRLTISVVIPTKDRLRNLMECLKSIDIQTLLPNEVIIVDASVTPAFKDQLSQYSKLNIKYVHTDRSGTTIQRNIGIKLCTGDIIVFSDDDMIWDLNYLNEIVSVFYTDPEQKIGGVTGRIIFREQELCSKKSLINKCLRLGALSQMLSIIFFLTRYGNGKFQLSGRPTIVRSHTSKLTKCEFLYGASTAFRSKIIKEFMFDEKLCGYGWGDDDDIAYRISRQYQNYYAPNAIAIHNNISPSTRGNKYTSRKIAIQNHYYLFKKNLPQSFKYKLAFYWSVMGLLVVETLNGMRHMEYSGLKGLIDGIKKILRQPAKM